MLQFDKTLLYDKFIEVYFMETNSDF